MIGEIKVCEFINSEVLKVSFEVFKDDWCLLQQSDTWKRIEIFLAASGSQGKQLPLVEKVNLLEGCLELPYRERNAAESVKGDDRMAERHYVYHVTGNSGSYVFHSQQDAIQAINMLAPYHDLILDTELVRRQLEKIGYYEKWPLSIQRVQEP